MRTLGCLALLAGCGAPDPTPFLGDWYGPTTFSTTYGSRFDRDMALVVTEVEDDVAPIRASGSLWAGADELVVECEGVVDTIHSGDARLALDCVTAAVDLDVYVAARGARLVGDADPPEDETTGTNDCDNNFGLWHSCDYTEHPDEDLPVGEDLFLRVQDEAYGEGSVDLSRPASVQRYDSRKDAERVQKIEISCTDRDKLRIEAETTDEVGELEFQVLRDENIAERHGFELHEDGSWTVLLADPDDEVDNCELRRTALVFAVVARTDDGAIEIVAP